jgi:O-antigen/teichoic acid export membrane protein
MRTSDDLVSLDPAPATVWRHALDRLRQVASDSLLRNSFFLLLTMALTSASGFLFWALCTRLYSQAEVGYGTALLSALNFATSLASLGLNRAMVRFYYTRDRRQPYLSANVVVSIGAALLVSAAIATALPHFGVRDVSVAVFATFCLGAVLFSVKASIESVFIAMRCSSLTFAENLGMNASKLALPAILVGAGYLGIFLSQVLGLLVAVLVATALLRRRLGYRLFGRPDWQALRETRSFATGSYLSDLVGNLPNSALPVILLDRLGPESSALWFVAVQIVTILFLICSSITQSLFAEASADEANLLRHVRTTAGAMAAVMLPAVLLIEMFAPQILALFGHRYQAGALPLRLLAGSALLVMVSYLTGSILSILRKVRYLTLVNAANAVLVIGLALTAVHSLVGMGWVWILGEVLNVALFAGGALFWLRRSAHLGGDRHAA